LKTQKAEEEVEIPKLFLTKGGLCRTVRVKVDMPIVVREKICEVARRYAKCGLTREVFKQLFLNGYDLVERTCGIESFINHVHEEKKKLKKERAGAIKGERRKGMGESHHD